MLTLVMPYKDPIAAKARGIRRYATRDKESWNRYRRELYQRTSKVFQDFKKTLCCKSCGKSGSSDLHFHHRNPLDKLFDISTRACICLSEMVLIEIGKCDVLCRQCHFKTFKDVNIRKAKLESNLL